MVGGQPAQGGGLASVKVIRLAGNSSGARTEYKALRSPGWSWTTGR
ncbi:MAG: hypothetical protein U0800_06935 [Isosphaeraceae bacterium]